VVIQAARNLRDLKEDDATLDRVVHFFCGWWSVPGAWWHLTASVPLATTSSTFCAMYPTIKQTIEDEFDVEAWFIDFDNIPALIAADPNRSNE
jgi:hypothetical protein